MSNMQVNMGGMVSLACSIDSEWKAIMMRLFAYGFRSRGSKTADKELLHSIEIKLAQMENCVSSKFLTVSKQEQEKIQEKKKEKKVENNPQAYPNTQKGAKILGEQLYLAIKMKKEWEDKEKKLKVEKNKKIS